MAKFVFRLQAVLNYKKQLENSVKNELGREQKKLEFEKEKLQSFIKERESYFESYRNITKDGVVVSFLRGFSNYYSSIKRRIELQINTIGEFEKRISKIRAKLIKVSSEKKIIEKLKEKEFEKFRKEQLIIEQNISEEIFSYKFIKNSEGKN